MMDEVGSVLRRKYRDEGEASLDAGDYDAAIASLTKSLDIQQDRRAMFYLAQAYEGKGDTANANKWYQKIIDEYPGTQYAQDAEDYMEANGGSTEGADSGQDEGENSSGDSQADTDQNGGADEGDSQDGAVSGGAVDDE